MTALLQISSSSRDNNMPIMSEEAIDSYNEMGIFRSD
jgi:hypothetical protein